MGLCWFAGKTILRKRQGNSLHPQRCLKVKSRLAEMLQEIVLLLSEGLSQSLHQFSLSPPDLVEGTIERSPGTQQRKWEMPQGSRLHLRAPKHTMSLRTVENLEFGYSQSV